MRTLLSRKPKAQSPCLKQPQNCQDSSRDRYPFRETELVLWFGSEPESHFLGFITQIPAGITLSGPQENTVLLLVHGSLLDTTWFF